MKNILSSLSNEEKNRILEMHKTATRKNYLNEGVIIRDIGNVSGSGKTDTTDMQAVIDKTNSFKPEEIVNFVKNGGPIEQGGKIITSDDNTKGYKFNNLDSAGNPVLRFLSGEGKALTIDANNKTFTFSERGGMSDQWSNKGSGRISFDGAKIGLWGR